jgi:hypothetical protein
VTAKIVLAKIATAKGARTVHAHQELIVVATISFFLILTFKKN